MRKSLLLFFLLIFAVVLWKLTEASDKDKWNDATVEQMVSESEEGKMANNDRHR